MKNEARALCDAAEAFQAACNDLHRAQESIAEGAGGTPAQKLASARAQGRWRMRWES